MKKLFKSYVFNITLIIVLSALALYFSMRNNYQEVIAALKHLNIGWIILIGAIILGYHAIIGLILTMLTKLSNPDYKFKQGYFNALIAAFFHGITPSASGGQFIQMYVFKKQKVDLSESASILWMDFIIYQATMVFTVLVLLILRFQYFYNHHSQLFSLVLIGFAINGSIIVGLWAVTRFSKVYTWITSTGIKIACKLHIVKNQEKAISSMDAGIQRFEQEAAKMKAHKPLLIKVFLANIVRLLLYYTFPIICALALKIPVPVGVVLDLIALTSYVSMINAFFPVPGGSGGTEATFVLMFSTIIGVANATSTMIVWRFFTYYFIMIIGAICFIWFKKKSNDIEE